MSKVLVRCGTSGNLVDVLIKYQHMQLRKYRLLGNYRMASLLCLCVCVCACMRACMHVCVHVFTHIVLSSCSWFVLQIHICDDKQSL